MRQTIGSLRKQLAEAEENLRLVRERKSEFVQETDIPLQVIKDERRLEREITGLQAQLGQDVPVSTTSAETQGARLPPARPAPVIDLPWPFVLFFNCLIPFILALVLGPPVSLPCVSPLGSALSEFVILLLLFHLVWHYLNPVIKEFSDWVKLGAFALPIKALAALFDALHPQMLFTSMLGVVVIVLSLVAGILGLSPLSPFHIMEPPPIIQHFLVHYPDSRTGTFAAGDLVEVPAYTQVLVEAVISGQADVLCTWAVVKGRQIPAKGCATLYSPPLEGNRDTLSVLAQSPCKTWQAFAGLHIDSVQVEP